MVSFGQKRVITPEDQMPKAIGLSNPPSIYRRMPTIYQGIFLPSDFPDWGCRSLCTLPHDGAVQIGGRSWTILCGGARVQPKRWPELKCQTIPWPSSGCCKWPKDTCRWPDGWKSG